MCLQSRDNDNVYSSNFTASLRHYKSYINRDSFRGRLGNADCCVSLGTSGLVLSPKVPRSFHVAETMGERPQLGIFAACSRNDKPSLFGRKIALAWWQILYSAIYR